MRKVVAFVAVLALSFATVASPGVLAQSEVDYQGHGEATPADQAISDGVVGFVNMFVERMNAQDPTIVNVANEGGLSFFLTDSYNEALANVENGMFVEIIPYGIGDVLVHTDGAISVQVVFSGYTSGWQTTVQTERWYLIPDGSGSFILNDYSFEPLSVPDSVTSSTVTLTLSNEGLELGSSEISSAEVIVFDVTNVETNFTSTGIYALPEGTTVDDVQASLAADPFSGEGWIGKTPMFPGPGEWSFGFLMEPGTYIVQQFTLDDTGNVADVPQGVQFGATLTVVEEGE